MGRAENRRLEKQKRKERTVTYNLTKTQLDAVVREKVGDELKQIKQEATDDAINTALVLLFTLPLEVLLDKYWDEFGEKIPEFAEYLLEYYEKWQNDELDMNKAKEDLWKYAGIRLEEER